MKRVDQIMAGHLYDKDGKAIDASEFTRLGELEQQGIDYKRVAQDTVRDDNGNMVWISTVWLGIDHNYGDGPPLIFETMTFIEDQGVSQWRYATLGEARKGHETVVALIKDADLRYVKDPDAWGTYKEEASASKRSLEGTTE